MKLFDNISKENLNTMKLCFNPVIREYQPGETIRTYQSDISSIGIVLNGKAHLYYIDYDGNYQLLEELSKDDIFGELFTLPVGNLEYILEADTLCRICLIPYSAITAPCSNACEHHITLTRNLFLIAAKKSQELSLRISFLSRKTVRQKLLTYFQYMSDTLASQTFRTHMSLSKLSEYLCVDRTSLMRELRYLNQEGIIISKGRNITLLKDLGDVN